MTSVDLVRFIGVSHLLQPPLTLFLASARGLDLRRRVVAESPLAVAIVHNMAFASVALPTTLGLLLALHAPDVARPGAARDLALVVAAFWCWRLYRQLTALRSAWPAAPRRASALNAVLTAIFVVQGPMLGVSILACP